MAATTLISFDEFERLDFGADDVELLKGVLIRMPPPFNDHMDVCEYLYEKLKAAVELLRASNPDLRLGKVHIERGYRFPTDPPSWLRPDVSLTYPDQPVGRFYLGAPQIAFEIVSASETAADLDEKVTEYLANGAAEVWLIYPRKGHAWVYDASGAARLVSRSIHTSVLPGVEIPFSAIGLRPVGAP
jgi:Uma2 family endonuclease